MTTRHRPLLLALVLIRGLAATLAASWLTGWLTMPMVAADDALAPARAATPRRRRAGAAGDRGRAEPVEFDAVGLETVDRSLAFVPAPGPRPPARPAYCGPIGSTTSPAPPRRWPSSQIGGQPVCAPHFDPSVLHG